MSEKHVDPRIVRTQKLLKEALAELIEEKGIDGITVKDLTAKAGLNRGTFYLNYVDKYDFLEKCEAEAISGLMEIAKDFNPTDAVYHLSRCEPYPPLIRMFEYLAEHARFFTAMLGPKGDPAFQSKIKKFLETHFYEKITKYQLRDKIKSVPIDYLNAYVTSAHLGIILHWLESGMNYTPQEMAAICFNISFNGPAGLLFANDRKRKR